MKKLTLKLTALAAALFCAGSAQAGDFDLSSLNGDEVRATAVSAPAPRYNGDDLIGMDMNIRVPFRLMQNAIVKMTVTEKRLTINDPSAPVIFKSGEFIKVSNLTVDANGIIVVPTLTLKPFIEGKDKLAIRVQRIQLHASMEPSVKAAPAAVDQEAIMAQVMEVLMKGIYSSVNAQLQAKKINMRAEDVIRLSYDKAAWTLHAAVSNKIIGQFIPAGLVGGIHLTGFSFNDSGLAIKLQTSN